MKKIILLMLLFLLTGCFKATPYEPWGEVYIKSKPNAGDAGVSDVVDFETKYKQYDLTEKRQIPVTVGIGYQYGAAYSQYAVLYIAVVSNDIVLNDYVYEYEDFNTIKYESTIPHDDSFLVMAFYDHFYPKYHEELEIEIPEAISEGYILVQKRYAVDAESGRYVKVQFKIINNVLTFKDSQTKYYQDDFFEE